VELDRLNEKEPWLEAQIRSRLLVICRHDYWPGLTPDKVWQLEYDLWPHLALQCDALTKQREDEAAEIRRLRR
tara:strand:- start:1973 stop:2191 length:219 start_codon:yes stop_codon:yes gene_type:complete